MILTVLIDRSRGKRSRHVDRAAFYAATDTAWSFRDGLRSGDGRRRQVDDLCRSVGRHHRSIRDCCHSIGSHGGPVGRLLQSVDDRQRAFCDRRQPVGDRLLGIVERPLAVGGCCPLIDAFLHEIGTRLQRGRVRLERVGVRLPTAGTRPHMVAGFQRTVSVLLQAVAAKRPRRATVVQSARLQAQYDAEPLQTVHAAMLFDRGRRPTVGAHAKIILARDQVVHPPRPHVDPPVQPDGGRLRSPGVLWQKLRDTHGGVRDGKQTFDDR